MSWANKEESSEDVKCPSSSPDLNCSFKAVEKKEGEISPRVTAGTSKATWFQATRSQAFGHRENVRNLHRTALSLLQFNKLQSSCCKAVLRTSCAELLHRRNLQSHWAQTNQDLSWDRAYRRAHEAKLIRKATLINPLSQETFTLSVNLES